MTSAFWRTDEAFVRDIARRLPKAELHLHLDGSLPADFILSESAASGFPLPYTASTLRKMLLNEKGTGLRQVAGGNWKHFDFCNSFLQTASGLAKATERLVRELNADHNVRVLEIRFCPALHTLGELDENAAVAAVTSAFSKAAADTGVRGGILLCALRSKGPVHATETFRLAKEWRGLGVIGIDVAGDEAAFPLSDLKEPLQQAVRDGTMLTVHAGEWVEGGKDNLLLAVELGAKRIGHGLVVVEDGAIQAVKSHSVYIETCITSNCTGHGKIPKGAFELHPVKEMLEKGIRVSGFNSDNLLLSGTLEDQPNPTEEIVRAVLRCKLTWAQVRQVLLDGVAASFALAHSENDEAFVKNFTTEVDEVLGEVVGQGKMDPEGNSTS